MKLLKMLDDDKHFVLNVDGLDTHFIRWTKLTDDRYDYGFRVSELRTGNFFDFRLPIDKVSQALGAEGVVYRAGAQIVKELSSDV
jgi:hypothetical protein